MSFSSRFLEKVITPRNLVIFYFVVCLAASVQQVLLGTINNILMYVEPVRYLFRHETMYVLHGEAYYDLYKYSPTFAFFMGIFYWLPRWAVTILWNLLNTAVLLRGVHLFCKTDAAYSKKMLLALALLFFEWLTSTQNCQSNSLIAGLILCGFYLLKNEKPFWAALLFSCCLFIKFYGVAGAIVFIFFPKKWKFLCSMAFWTLLLFFIPVLFIPLDWILSEYKSWLLIAAECKTVEQLSVMGILESWFNITDPFIITEITGLAILLLPLLRFKNYHSRGFAGLFLCSFLVFIVIFNKMSESPTYIIALTGVALWFTSKKNYSAPDIIPLFLVLVFASLSPTDLMPAYVREHVTVPYKLKAFAVVLVWIKIQYELWTYRREAMVTEQTG